MSSSAKLTRSKVDASYSVVITCDFEADLSDKTLDEEFPLQDVPLAGDWTLKLAGSDDGVRIDLSHELLDFGRVGHLVACGCELYWCDSGVFKLVDEGGWDACPTPDMTSSGEVEACFECHGPDHEPFNRASDVPDFDSKGRHQYRLVFSLQQQCLKARHGSHSAETLAEGLGGAPFKPAPHDFRLFFPKLGSDGASLWVNADVLSGTCPYFEDLLASDFAESAPRRSKRQRKSRAQPVNLKAVPVDEQDFEDSDDETDEFRFARHPPTTDEPPDDLAFREITITQTAFSTYHALLTFLQTNYLRFAPLKSACKPSNPADIKTRSEFTKEAHEYDPSLPLPVSPKSLYRLVDLLRIPETTGLSALCLDTLSDSLTFHGAASELFSDASIHLELLRKAVLTYIATNWAEVSGTASWKEYAAKVKAGELPGTEGIMLELVEAREQAMNKSAPSLGFPASSRVRLTEPPSVG
ncbi:hypothetical protein JCM10207_009183 [Rhodosporidiobolus poonsookiae]